jgi:hypothetical protein
MLTEQQRQIVKRARDRIAEPAHWCQGTFARTADGFECLCTDPRVQRFCAFGVLVAECAAQDGWNASANASVLAILLAPRGLAAINDGPDGHRKVLALFGGPCRGLTIDPTS